MLGVIYLLSWSSCSRRGSDELAGNRPRPRPGRGPDRRRCRRSGATWPRCTAPARTAPRRVTGSSARSSGSSTGSAASIDKREQRWNVYALSLLAFSVVSVLCPLRPAAAAGHLPFNPTNRGAVTAVRLVQHRRQLPHQHQLAELLRRVDDDPPHPDGRARRAQLRVGGGRRGGRHRADPRARPHPHSHTSATSGSTSPAPSCASCCRSRSSSASCS